MTSQSELKDLFVQHRKNIRKFNTSVAEAVGLLRVRREGEKVGRQPDDLPEPKLPPPFDILGYKQVLFKDMKPDIVHKGKYIILTVLDIPHQYEFESADLHLSQYVSAVVLVKDEEGVAHRAFIYNYVKPDLCREYLGNEELVREGNIELNNLNRHLTQNVSLQVADPVLKIAADGKLALVVNEPAKVFSLGQAEKPFCAYCLEWGKKLPTCSKCHEVQYCNRECQRLDWVDRRHKYICETKEAAGKRLEDYFGKKLRPNWTVYELEDLCYSDFIPAQDQTKLRRDYGFVNCQSSSDEGKLLGVYQGLIKYIRVDMVELHKACEKNELFEFIKASFEPREDKGGYYPWLLQRPELVKQR